MSEESKQLSEQDVFRRFAALIGLDLVVAAFESCTPPLPDITFKRLGMPPAGYELAQVTDQESMHRLDGRNSLTKAIYDAYRDLQPATRERLHGREVFVRFAEHTSKRRRTQVLRRILEFVAEQLPSTVGMLELPSDLLDIVGDIEVRPTGLHEPLLGVDSSGNYGDSLLAMLKSKQAKFYEWEGPLELVLYYPVLSATYRTVAKQLQEHLVNTHTDSQFDRIWVIALDTDRVLLEYPQSSGP